MAANAISCVNNMRQGLPPDATPADFRIAAMRAVKLTLLDSGIDDDTVAGPFGQVAFEDTKPPMEFVWNAELNKRRFELIDGDIQGTLSRLRPPKNTRPDGVDISWYAKRKRGLLAKAY